jgi:hypothetical protein
VFKSELNRALISAAYNLSTVEKTCGKTTKEPRHFPGWRGFQLRHEKMSKEPDRERAPTMEEILAAIRRTFADDEDQEMKPRAAPDNSKE